jgi:hypothetical protein
MANGKKARVDGKKKAHDPRAKDLEARKPQAIAGGRSGASLNEIVVIKNTDVSSSKL